MVGSVIEVYLTATYDQSGYQAYAVSLSQIGGIIQLGVVLLSLFFLPWLQRHGVKIIVIAGLYSAVYLTLIPWIDLSLIRYLAIFYSPFGLLFGIVWIGLLIEYIPSTNKAWWYQIFALVVLVSRMVFDAVGVLLVPWLGYPVLFLLSALILWFRDPKIPLELTGFCGILAGIPATFGDI